MGFVATELPIGRGNKIAPSSVREKILVTLGRRKVALIGRRKVEKIQN